MRHQCFSMSATTKIVPAFRRLTGRLGASQFSAWAFPLTASLMIFGGWGETQAAQGFGITPTLLPASQIVCAGKAPIFTMMCKNETSAWQDVRMWLFPDFPDCRTDVERIRAHRPPFKLTCSGPAASVGYEATLQCLASHNSTLYVDVTTADVYVADIIVSVTRTTSSEESVGYEVLVTNSGEVDLKDIVVHAPRALDCALGSSEILPPTETLTHNCTKTLNPGQTTFTNFVWVEATPFEPGLGAAERCGIVVSSDEHTL